MRFEGRERSDKKHYSEGKETLMNNKSSGIKFIFIFLAVMCCSFYAHSDEISSSDWSEHEPVSTMDFHMEGGLQQTVGWIRDNLEFNPHIWEEIDGLEVIEDGETPLFKRYGVAIEDLPDYEVNELYEETHNILLNEQLETIRMITEQQRHLRDIQNVQRTLQQIRSTGHQVPARAPQQPPRPPQQPPRPPQR